MSTYVNHRGEYRGTNIGLTFGATMGFVLGLAAIATITMPHWGLAATSSLATLAAFAATPLGIGILVTFAISFALLVGSIIYGISKNNQISEMKGPKLVIIENDKNCDVLLKVTEEDYEYIKTNHQNKDEKGDPIEDEYRIDFTNSKGERMHITGKSGNSIQFGNTLHLEIRSVAVKDKDGKYNVLKENDKKLSALGLGAGEKDKKERPIDILPSPKVEALKVKKPKAEEKAKETTPTKQ